MVVLRMLPVTLTAVCLLSGCMLWPPPPGGTVATTSPRETTMTGAPPPLGTGSFKPAGVTLSVPSGTLAGQKVMEIQAELKRLDDAIATQNGQLQRARAKIAEESRRYQATAAAMGSALQARAAPGDPMLMERIDAAKADLDQLSADIGALNQLSMAVATDAATATALGESVRATSRISGALEADRKNLVILQSELDRTAAAVDGMRRELSQDIRLQTTYVAAERSNLNLLAAGIRSDQIQEAGLSNKVGTATSGAGAPADDTSERQPLIVIRFDQPDVRYEQAVTEAVSAVLDQRPDASFDLVAVSPSRGGAAQVALESTKIRGQTEAVMGVLVDMGLPPSRIAMLARTSPSAAANEVHLYVR